MPNHDPNFGIAFVVGIFVVAIFVTLFPEKEPEQKSIDPDGLDKKTKPRDA